MYYNISTNRFEFLIRKHHFEEPKDIHRVVFTFEHLVVRIINITLLISVGLYIHQCL